MRSLVVIMLMFFTGFCYAQSPVKYSPASAFRLATLGVTTDTTLQNWKVLSVQHIKVSFYFSAKTIKMVMPLHTEVMPILKTYRKNGAIIYLVRHTPKAKAAVMRDGKYLRYILRTNQNRFFQTCYEP